MLGTFLNAVRSVFVILLLTASGYFIAAKGWMQQRDKDFINRILLNIMIPCSCFHGIYTRVTRETIRSSAMSVLVPLLSMLCMYVASLLIARLIRLPKRRLGLFLMLTATPNVLLVGYAMCKELFTDACTPYVIMFYVASNTLLYFVSISVARMSMSTEKGNFGKTFTSVLKMPVMITLISCFTCVAIGIKIPATLLSFMSYMNGCVTPLALILTGFIIHSVGLRSMKLNKTVLGVMLLRFVIAPLISLGFCRLFGIEGLGRNVILVLSAMPSASMCVVIASRYGDVEDEALVSQAIAWTSIATFAVTPVIMMLLG